MENSMQIARREAMSSTDVREQAAAWLIRCDSGQLSADERSAFQVWLDADPRHRIAYLRLQVAWKRVDRLKALGMLNEIEADVVPQRTWWRGPQQLGIAAAVLVAIGLLIWLVASPFGWTTYSTDIGNSERIVLPDGSRMILNTNSRARVRFDAKRRVISLMRGEAHFEVAHEAQRPFDVTASDVVVRAVGTAFSVRLYDKQRIEVLVSQGRVALSSPPAAHAPDKETGTADSPALAQLDAGEAVTIRPEGLQVNQIVPSDMSRKLAWQTGLLRFNGETLVEAVAEFNRYNRRQLKIVDPGIADIHIGGGFQTTDIDSFLAALKKSFGVKVQHADAMTIRLSGTRPVERVDVRQEAESTNTETK